MNLTTQMQTYFPPEIYQRLVDAGQIAGELGITLYLIGGSIRDLLLNRSFDWDVDLVGERRVGELAEAIHQAWGGQMSRFPEFGTSKIHLDKPLTIDIATARIEVYDGPGANPTVEFSHLEDDLIRRDFTINAMAIRLEAPFFGELIDPFGGERDIRRKSLKALHERKFIEDPVRSWRACRFSICLGFEIETQTESLITEAMASGYFDGFVSERIRKEFYRSIQSEEAHSYLSLLSRLGVLRCLHAQLSFTPLIQSQFKRMPDYQSHFSSNERGLVCALLLFLGLPEVDIDSALGHLDGIHLQKYGQEIHLLRNLPKALSPAQLFAGLKPISDVALWTVLCLDQSPSLKSQILLYLRELKPIKLGISGNIIKQWLTPGPEIGNVLKQVLTARLNGEIKASEEETFAFQIAQKYLGKD